MGTSHGEERAAALEERGLASEAHIATLTEQQQKSKWPRVPPSLVAMLNKPSGKSDADVQVVNDLAALGGEVGEMREMLLNQADGFRIQWCGQVRDSNIPSPFSGFVDEFRHAYREHFQWINTQCFLMDARCVFGALGEDVNG